MSKSQIVYVREADLSSVPEDVRSQHDKLYSLHNAENGEQLALAADRKLAFALARQHDLVAMSVH